MLENNSDNEVCLYNLFSGEMIKLDSYNSQLLLKCENNIPISDIEDTSFLEKLYSMGIGKYYDSKIYVEKLSLGIGKLSDRNKQNLQITRLFLEITNKCNLNCVFCSYLEDKAYKTTSCKRWKIKRKIINIEIQKNIIYQAFCLGLKQLIFIGGEPLYEINNIIKLIKYAKTLDINNFVIYTNLLLLNNDIISIIKTYNIFLEIQMYTFNEFEFENICNKKYDSSFLNKLVLLNRNSINFSIKILVNKFNEDSVDKTISTLNNYINGCNIKIDFIYPHNKLYCSTKYLDYIYNKSNKLIKVSLEQYMFNKKFHNCFGNQIALTADGYILPCIMMRNIRLGSIYEAPLHQILMKSVYVELQKLNKEKIEICNTCNLKYGCFDCRAIEMEVHGDLYKTTYCESFK